MTTDPAGKLVWPKVDESLETANNIIGFTSYISPSYWLGELADWLLGQNPWEEASRMIAGDWRMVSESGAAVGHLAEFNNAFAVALHEQSAMLFGQQFWAGKAATDAENYFRNLERAVLGQADLLEDIAFQIKKLTLAVNQTADRIKGLLEQLTDALITLGVGSYIKAGVAYITGGAKATFAARRATVLWKQIIQEYDRLVNGVKTFLGPVMVALTSLRRDFRAISPKGYDHLGVQPPKPKQDPKSPKPDRAPSQFYGTTDPDNSGLFY